METRRSFCPSRPNIREGKPLIALIALALIGAALGTGIWFVNAKRASEQTTEIPTKIPTEKKVSLPKKHSDGKTKVLAPLKMNSVQSEGDAGGASKEGASASEPQEGYSESEVAPEE